MYIPLHKLYIQYKHIYRNIYDHEYIIFYWPIFVLPYIVYPLV